MSRLRRVEPTETASFIALPIQAAPINRSEILQSFTIQVPVGKNPAGKDAFLAVVKGPEPNNQASFLPGIDPSLGVCWLLSPYAVAPCLWSGGLFSRRR